MDHLKIANELLKNKDVFKELLNDLTKEEYLWKPQPDKWCLLEVVCHLYDEELEDFRARTKHVLENPTQPLPPTDPPGWVLERNYIQQNYTDTLNKFLKERDESVKWLQSLKSPKWNNEYQHPKMGPLKAKMFLVNWPAHDYLHIRQITKLKFDYLKNITGENLNYAGDW
jgi:hypothetical protein